jgi:hypothetical protein
MLDITTLAAWGEFIGGIAVVVSLVYLAAQIRANTKTVRASNYSDISVAAEEANTSILNAEVASLLVLGLADFAALSAEDQWRFNSLMSLMVSPVHRAWDLHQRALIDDKMWETQVHVWVALYENPGVKQWWETSQHWWPAEFRDFVQEATAA